MNWTCCEHELRNCWRCPECGKEYPGYFKATLIGHLNMLKHVVIAKKVIK